MDDVAFFIEDSITGLLAGGIYALIALGIVFVFRATKVFNFAHGALLMMGAYFFYTFCNLFEWLGAGAWSVYILSLPLALVASALFGMLIERLLMRPMMGEHPFPLIMITIGLISVLEGGAAMVWSSAAQYPPAIIPLHIDFVGSIAINRQMAISCFIALLVFAAIWWLFLKSKTGISIRATASDQSTAYAMGINVPWVFSLAWIVAAISAGLAGLLLAPLNSLTPSLGVIGLSVISVVILGGLDSVIGVLIAAFIVGWLEAMANHFLGGAYKDVVPYVVVLLIILVRPYGLMGTPDVDRL